MSVVVDSIEQTTADALKQVETTVSNETVPNKQDQAGISTSDRQDQQGKTDSDKPDKNLIVAVVPNAPRLMTPLAEYVQQARANAEAHRQKVAELFPGKFSVPNANNPTPTVPQPNIPKATTVVAPEPSLEPQNPKEVKSESEEIISTFKQWVSENNIDELYKFILVRKTQEKIRDKCWELIVDNQPIIDALRKKYKANLKLNVANFKQWIKDKNIQLIGEYIIDEDVPTEIKNKLFDLIIDETDILDRLFEYPSVVRCLVTGPSGILRDDKNLIYAFGSRNDCFSRNAISYMKHYVPLYNIEDLIILLRACLSKFNSEIETNLMRVYELYPHERRFRIKKAHIEFFTAYMDFIKNRQEELLKSIEPNDFKLFDTMLEFNPEFVLTYLPLIREHCKVDKRFLGFFMQELDWYLEDQIRQHFSISVDKDGHKIGEKPPREYSREYARANKKIPDLFRKLEKYYPEFIENRLDFILDRGEYSIQILRDKALQPYPVTNRDASYFWFVRDTDRDPVVERNKRLEQHIAWLEKEMTATKNTLPAATFDVRRALPAVHCLMSPVLPNFDKGDDKSRHEDNAVQKFRMVCVHRSQTSYVLKDNTNNNEPNFFLSCEIYESRPVDPEQERMLAAKNEALVSTKARSALPPRLVSYILSFIYQNRFENPKFQAGFYRATLNIVGDHMANAHIRALVAKAEADAKAKAEKESSKSSVKAGAPVVLDHASNDLLANTAAFLQDCFKNIGASRSRDTVHSLSPEANEKPQRALLLSRVNYPLEDTRSVCQWSQRRNLRNI